ncbi:hypothetical protein H0B56_08860 [Haloechinothrix sp. YIM 98757]|uniref:Uncharacterized protein n=1 Tax=Haloechinothrix aidingensis TaxID=2752311 RepID=A0A837ZYD4_9PSEU|nr:hypothetical protein [Haloechinothrix aidingensis]MBA0125646.1 hypothetical protein [Haloechinothrix aidingensis]
MSTLWISLLVVTCLLMIGYVLGHVVRDALLRRRRWQHDPRPHMVITDSESYLDSGEQ